MGFYDRFDSVRKEYEKFKLEEKRYSAYSSTEFLQSIKGLLEAYEGEEYTVNNDMINCLKFSISPLDSSSLSLKLEIEKQYDDFFMREEDYFILLPSRLRKVRKRQRQPSVTNFSSSTPETPLRWTLSLVHPVMEKFSHSTSNSANAGVFSEELNCQT